LKITEVVQHFVLPFSTEKAMYKFSQKNGLGYTLGDFFTKSSGHPVSELPLRKAKPINQLELRLTG
jgi:hypothetical protein